MSDLQSYLLGADEERAVLLRRQWREAVGRRVVTCPCGLVRALELAFRCLYCGVFFCTECAEVHFGETRREWLERKGGIVCESCQRGDHENCIGHPTIVEGGYATCCCNAPDDEGNSVMEVGAIA
jgi:hypothetical protein